MNKFNDIGIKRINNILRFQKEFKWQDITSYLNFKNSFEYHVEHHPIAERKYGKWDSLINYKNRKTLYYSYFKTSTDLSKNYSLLNNKDLILRYNSSHESYNIMNLKNGLMVCLKFNKYKLCFDIATCYFPSRKVKNFFEREDNYIYSTNSNNIHYTLYKEDIEQHDKKCSFEEMIENFFRKKFNRI